MRVVCIATHRNEMLREWEASARHWGYRTVVIGEGVPWEGFKTFTTLLLAFLKAQPDMHEIIAIVDAYDVVFTGPPSELMRKYKAFGKPIVTGGEDECLMNCYRHKCKVNNEQYRHVNTGFVMGPVWALVHLYEYTLKHSRDDDQIGVGKYMDKHCDRVAMDGNQHIVANLRSASNIQPLPNKRFLHKKTKSTPVMVHTPFMYMDLGKRSDLVKSHIFPDYKSPGKWHYFVGYVKHIMKHGFNNPHYRPVWVVGIAAIVLIITTIAILVRASARR